MGFQERICTVCLKKCDNFKTIDGNAKNALDILLLKIDFSVIQKPVMCKICAEMLRKCFDFKATCLHTYNYVVPFVNKKAGVKLDLKDVYQNRRVTGSGISEDQDVCEFCMSLVKKHSTFSPDVEKEDALLKKMIERCLPELDLSIIKKPVICAPCRGSLENCFCFMTNRLNVEEKMKKYWETLEIRNEDQVELSSLLRFSMNDLTTSEVNGNSIDIIKVEEHRHKDGKNPDEKQIGNGGNTIKLGRVFPDDSEDVNEDVENKNENFTKIDKQKVTQVTCEEGSYKLDFIEKEEIVFEDETNQNDEKLVEMEDQRFLVDQEIEIKPDDQELSRVEDGFVSPHLEVATRLHRSPKRLPSNLKEARSKEIMNHCEYCLYQTKYRYQLKCHLLVHKDPSDITMYKCNSCSFQTKYKLSLKKHLLMHQDLSEVTVYKCDTCPFQTKHKRSLYKHLQKDPLNVTMYKCDSCSFQTMNHHCLKNHLPLHKDPLEVPMFKCDSCSYRTKYKGNLGSHLLMHKDPSKMTLYKCDSCSFQTRHIGSFYRHLVVHKDPSELIMYNCDSCSFQTKHRNILKKHLLGHKEPKDPSEVSNKCGSCSFQTKTITGLKNHLLVHKDPSEVTVHNCNSCSFQTKHLDALKRHLLMHK